MEQAFQFKPDPHNIPVMLTVSGDVKAAQGNQREAVFLYERAASAGYPVAIERLKDPGRLLSGNGRELPDQ